MMSEINSYLDIALIVYSLLVSIAAITPTEKDDYVLGRLRNLVVAIKNLRGK